MDTQQLSEKVLQLEAAKEYFTTGLQMQTGIFSTIVTVVVVLMGLLSYWSYKQKIKEEVAKQSKILNDSLIAAIKKENDILKQEMREMKKTNMTQVAFLQADIARVFARQSAIIKDYPTAFNWWVRTARFMCEAGRSEKMVRDALVAAIVNSKNLVTINGIEMDRFNEHIEIIDSKKYAQEVKVLKDKIQELVGK